MADAAAGAAFTIEVLGLTLGTFSAVKGLEVSVDVLEYREGGINDVVHRLPGAVTYPNLILTSGLTSDAVVSWFAKTRLGAERHTRDADVPRRTPATPCARGRSPTHTRFAGAVRRSARETRRSRARSSRSPTAE